MLRPLRAAKGRGGARSDGTNFRRARDQARKWTFNLPILAQLRGSAIGPVPVCRWKSRTKSPAALGVTTNAAGVLSLYLIAAQNAHNPLMGKVMNQGTIAPLLGSRFVPVRAATAGFLAGSRKTGERS
jgi:hypothetical protein